MKQPLVGDGNNGHCVLNADSEKTDRIRAGEEGQQGHNQTGQAGADCERRKVVAIEGFVTRRVIVTFCVLVERHSVTPDSTAMHIQRDSACQRSRATWRRGKPVNIERLSAHEGYACGLD
jgi:hypothetical protein